MPVADAGPDLERRRLVALQALRLLDTPPEERFDRITRTAAALFDVPVALVTLVDTDRQWFKSCFGWSTPETPRSVSFCSHAIEHDEMLVVEDARADRRFAGNPLVTGGPHIAFYAGRPLAAPGGERVGTLCLIDGVPRTFGDPERARLDDLAQWAQTELTAGELAGDLAAREAAEQLQDDMVGALSHELRTPLTSVLGYAEALADGEAGELTPEQREYVGTVADHARRLQSTVSDLLLAARLRGGVPPSSRTPVDVTALLRGAVEREQAAAAARGVRLAVTTQGAVVADADAEAVRRAVEALVRAGVDAAAPGATIDARTDEEHGDAVVRLAGVALDVPDGRLGTELGQGPVALALAARIADAHEDRLVARPGSPAVVELRLPAATAA